MRIALLCLFVACGRPVEIACYGGVTGCWADDAGIVATKWDGCEPRCWDNRRDGGAP